MVPRERAARRAAAIVVLRRMTAQFLLQGLLLFGGVVAVVVWINPPWEAVVATPAGVLGAVSAGPVLQYWTPLFSRARLYFQPGDRGGGVTVRVQLRPDGVARLADAWSWPGGVRQGERFLARVIEALSAEGWVVEAYARPVVARKVYARTGWTVEPRTRWQRCHRVTPASEARK